MERNRLLPDHHKGAAVPGQAIPDGTETNLYDIDVTPRTPEIDGKLGFDANGTILLCIRDVGWNPGE